jgi:hypothetical protein
MYKVGDKITKKDGTVKTITLFDQLAALGGSDLKRASSNQIGDIKQWNKLDRFVHGFIVCTRMLKEKSGKKLLKECNIEINNLTMEQILEDYKTVNNF